MQKLPQIDFNLTQTTGIKIFLKKNPQSYSNVRGIVTFAKALKKTLGKGLSSVTISFLSHFCDLWSSYIRFKVRMRLKS